MVGYKKRYTVSEREESSCSVCAFSNFNGIAPLGLVLFLISIVLAGVALGLDRWSRQEVDRGNGITTDSSTYKVQGVIRRCVEYSLSDEVVQLNLPSEQLPQDSCLENSDLSCSNSVSFLQSAHDSPSVDELQSTDSTDDCQEVRTRLMVSFSFVIIGIIVSFIGAVFSFPLFHRGFFLVGALCGFVATLCHAIALGVYQDSDEDFAGFFSLNGKPSSGCLDISYGLAVGAAAVNLIGCLVDALAFCYKTVSRVWSSDEK